MIVYGFHVHRVSNVKYASKKKVKNMNKYMQPLINDLLYMWVDGVKAYYAITKSMFTLHACMLWSIHDYPRYGIISSLQT